MHQQYKKIILENFIDRKGRLCSPKLKDSYVNKIEPELLKLKKEYNMEYTQLFYHIIKNIPHNYNKCEICDRETEFRSFFIGYLKTCKSESCLKKSYGKNPPILSEDIRKKISKRMKEKNPMFIPEIVVKSHTTTQERYGCKPYLSDINKQKSLETRYDIYSTFSPKSILYKPKEYTLPSGVMINVQGYENIALDILLKEYKEEQIIVCGKKYFFKYLYKDKIRTYYPDIYIPGEKLFIEVKSPYTLNIDYDKNLVKRNIIIENGYNHKFMIISKNQNIITISYL